MPIDTEEATDTPDLIDDMMPPPVDDLPPVRAEPPEPASDTAPEPAPDPANDVFNPDIHVTDAAGNPVLKSDGSYARKRGRKKGSKAPSREDTAAVSAAIMVTPVDEIIAGTFVMLLDKLQQWAFGQAAAFANEEISTLRAGWAKVSAQYLPEFALTPLGAASLTTGMVLLARLGQPEFAKHAAAKFTKRKTIVDQA